MISSGEESDWDWNYKENNNRIECPDTVLLSCPAHISVQGYLRMKTIEMRLSDQKFPALFVVAFAINVARQH